MRCLRFLLIKLLQKLYSSFSYLGKQLSRARISTSIKTFYQFLTNTLPTIHSRMSRSGWRAPSGFRMENFWETKPVCKKIGSLWFLKFLSNEAKKVSFYSHKIQNHRCLFFLQRSRYNNITLRLTAVTTNAKRLSAVLLKLWPRHKAGNFPVITRP